MTQLVKSDCHECTGRVGTMLSTFIMKTQFLLVCLIYFTMYGKCPKYLFTKLSDKMVYANSADPDQTTPKEQSDLGLHCLPFVCSIQLQFFMWKEHSQIKCVFQCT